MKKNIVTVILFMLVPCLSACQAGQHSKSMDVITIASTTDKYLPDHEICRSFSLTREDVAIYFSVAEEVDEYEFNKDAIILPCKYRGTIDIRGEIFHWEISAGGAGYLYRGKGVNKRYLCKKNCCAVLPNLC